MSGGEILLLLALLLLWIYIIYQEWFRANRGRRIWRLLAGTGAVLSLVLILFPIRLNKQNSRSQAIVLTEGFEADSIQAFLKQRSKSVKLYSATSVNSNLFRQAVLVEDPFLLADSLAKYDSVFVFGNGFYDFELEAFKNIPFQFRAARAASGIQSISWPKQIAAGAQWKIQGRYQNPDSGTVKLYLKNAKVILDSAIISPSAISHFELKTIPAFSGRGNYLLTVQANNKDSIDYNIPFEIKPVKPASVLMLSSSPDFENRFLKDYLYQNGYQLVIRTNLSRDKFEYQYLNIEPVNISRINAETISNFEVLIADEGAIKNLGELALRQIVNQVQNKALGLLIRTTETSSAKPLMESFTLFTKNSGEQRLQVQLSGSEEKLPVIVQEKPFYIRGSEEIVPLLTTQTNEILAAKALSGSGKIVLTTIGNSFQWALSGNQKQYEMYWSELIKSVLPNAPPDFQLQTLSPLPIINDPAEIQLILKTDSLPEIFAGNARIAVQQQPFLKNRWNGRWWPDSSGWNPFRKAGTDSIAWIYVHNSGDWSILKNIEKRKATEQMQNRVMLAGKDSARDDIFKKNLLAPVFYFLLFILSSGYLWFEKKYFA